VLRAGTAFASTAAVAVAADLAHKTTVDAAYFHARSAGYVAFVLLFGSVWIGAILATRSTWIGLAGGVLAGGAIGNLASLALWPGIPNPIVLEPIAFNLADVFVVAGFVLTAASSFAFAIRNRERLGEPVRLR
jgi:lipoprotein signal peptidase